MKPSASARAALRSRIADMHAAGESYRTIARLYFPGVKHGVLQRIAKENHFPTDAKILRALGLVGERVCLPGERRTKRKIAKMAKETRKKVLVKHE